MSEIKLQSTCFQWLWNTHPQTRCCCFHVPNGASRNKIEAMQLKASGVIAGIPDILLIWEGSIHAFEFKTDTGRLSPSQVKVHQTWAEQGVEVVVIRSFEEWQVMINQIVKSYE